MGEILGLGMTHYPPLIGRDENMAGILRAVLRDPGLPARYREPAGWPAPMRREYGDDGDHVGPAPREAARQRVGRVPEAAGDALHGPPGARGDPRVRGEGARNGGRRHVGRPGHVTQRDAGGARAGRRASARGGAHGAVEV